MKIQSKRFYALALTAVWMSNTMPTGLAVYVATDATQTSGFSGDILVATNTVATCFDSLADYQDTGVALAGTSGVFTVQEGVVEAAENLMGYDENGLGIIDYTKDTPEIERTVQGAQVMEVDSGTAFAVGDTRTMLDVDVGITEVNYEFKVLAVGTYCNVWVPTATDADAEFIIDEEEAQEIADTYDTGYPDLEAYFGESLVPSVYTNQEVGSVSDDGKVNILCYDIDGDGNSNVNSYVGGYFWPMDMFPKSYGSGYNNLKIIHIDSAHGMASGVEQCYGTLFHESQHMINFGQTAQYSTVIDGYWYMLTMPTYLNEAFSEAADYLLAGGGAARVSWYNTDKYDTIASGKYSLTGWVSSLNNYSTSYLFGQYLRTQYAQVTGTDGTTIYKEVIACAKDGKTDADWLEDIATLLNMQDGATLLSNFYTALALQNEQGVYGFGGDGCVDDLAVHTATSTLVAAGGAVYYGAHEDVTPSGVGDDVVLISAYEVLDEAVMEATLTVGELEIALTHDKITLGKDQTATITVAQYDAAGKMLGLTTQALESGTNHTTVSMTAEDALAAVKAFFAMDNAPIWENTAVLMDESVQENT